MAWTIHDVFHVSLLTPYRETIEHGTNYTRPPPDLIEDAEEYEVEAILNHRHFGRKSCAASVRSREAHQVSLRDSQLATSGSKPHWHYYEVLGGLYTQRGVT